MHENAELAGYLEVKVPVSVRKRGFTPWKAWKRQWCIVNKSDRSGKGIVLRFGNSSSNYISIPIPRDATLCRTESRSRRYAFGIFLQNKQPVLFLCGTSECNSQEWMAHIRSLLKPVHVTEGIEVSLIENDHSRTANLSGLYGSLTVDSQGVKISNPTTAGAPTTWKWSQLHQFHLAVTENSDDQDKVCVIHTSNEFPAGPGQLLLFCQEAPKLLQCLLNKGSKMHLLRPAPSPPLSFFKGRRMSRSENDLRNLIRTSSVSSYHYCYAKPSSLARSHSGSRDSGVRMSAASDESDGLLRGKVATSLISAGLGLMFSTPGCSEADSEHEYQQVGFCNSDEDLTVSDNRRESGVSVASGIYEEIPDIDLPADSTESHYENISVINMQRTFQKNTPSPPPLPPRKMLFTTTHSSENINTKLTVPMDIPAPLQIRFNRALNSLNIRERCYSDSSALSNQRHSMQPSRVTLPAWDKNNPSPEPDYMPMSPIVRTPVSPAEEYYVAMASLNNTS